MLACSHEWWKLTKCYLFGNIFVEVFNAISSLLQIKHVWFWAKILKCLVTEKDARQLYWRSFCWWKSGTTTGNGGSRLYSVLSQCTRGKSFLLETRMDIPKLLISILCNHEAWLFTHSHRFWWNFLRLFILTQKEITDAWMLVFHYRFHGPKIIKNVMKDHLFCLIVSSRVKIVGLWFFFNL